MKKPKALEWLCTRVRWAAVDFRWWFRHHKLNPVPCTCYSCEMKKPLSPVLAEVIRRKLEDGTMPRRKLPRRDQKGQSDC